MSYPNIDDHSKDNKQFQLFYYLYLWAIRRLPSPVVAGDPSDPKVLEQTIGLDGNDTADII